MKQKKIAFVISSDEIGNWSGGISYYKNLFKVLEKEKKYKFVVFTNSAKFIKKNKFGDFFDIKEINFLKRGHIFYLLRKLIIFFLKKDILLYNYLIQENVTTLSHRKLFKNNKIKSIGWIPDLQHKVLKKFFKNNSYFEREKYIQNEIKNSDKIFVSSFQIKREFKYYYNIKEEIIPLRIMSERKHIKNSKIKNYLLFPAQFWEHKNHSFLINVAKKLKEKNLKIKIIFCGKIENYKNKNYFNEINSKIKEHKLENIIYNLGEVSLKKLDKLQNECIAFINPSYYEGWSTINEESRSKLKYIFLSNIKGHLEQKNFGSIFFDINSPNDFVKKLKIFLKKKPYRNLKKFKRYNKIFINKINHEAKLILRKEYN